MARIICLKFAYWIAIGLALLSPISASDAYALTIPSTPGWYVIPNTKLRSVCPNPTQFPELQMASHDCSGIVEDWSGGVLDTLRNRLLIRGGGHSGYWGNEMYALDVATQTLTRLENPSHYPDANFFSSCHFGVRLVPGTTNTPSASQGYNHLAYLPDTDQWFEWGSVSPPCGGFSNATFIRDMGTMTWHDRTTSVTGPVGSGNSTPGPTANFGRSARYDPNTHKVFLRDDCNIWTYDPVTNTYAKHETGSACSDAYRTSVIDPKRKLFITFVDAGHIGSGWAKTSIASTPYANMTPWAVTGCGTPSYNMGIEYDSVLDRIVFWYGGNTVWMLNPDTSSCTSVTYSGGPTAVANGTFGRFRFVPAYNVYVVLNSVDDNAYFLRLSSGSGSTSSDTTPPSVPGGLTATTVSSSQINLTWNASTDNVGVSGYKIYRNGSLNNSITGTNYSDTGLSSSTTYVYTVSALDAAGNESAQSASDSATTSQQSTGGSDFQSRCSGPGVIVCRGWDTAAEFNTPVSPGTGLYPGQDGLIHGSRDTTTMASGAGSLKFTILSGTGANSAGFWLERWPQEFHENSTFYIQWRQRFDTNMVNLGAAFGGGGWKQAIFHNYAGGSCANIDLVVNNQGYRAFPFWYTECGAASPEFSITGDVVFEYSNPYPPGSDGPIWCLYHLVGNPANKCMFYRANEWMTFYIELHLGTFNQPNSTVKMYVGYEGQPLQLTINNVAYTYHSNPNATQGFETSQLTPYDTGKDGRAHPTAVTWYDEHIVSSQPIPPPSGGGVLTNPPPAAPRNLQVQ